MKITVKPDAPVYKYKPAKDFPSGTFLLNEQGMVWMRTNTNGVEQLVLLSTGMSLPVTQSLYEYRALRPGESVVIEPEPQK